MGHSNEISMSVGFTVSKSRMPSITVQSVNIHANRQIPSPEKGGGKTGKPGKLGKNGKNGKIALLSGLHEEVSEPASKALGRVDIFVTINDIIKFASVSKIYWPL